MNDREMLDLIEHHKWNIYPLNGDSPEVTWSASGSFGRLEKSYKTIREAIREALTAQRKWATGG